ncbi:hypothetical protein DWB85_16085 [Seongchinamella sediminis]|uniref:Sulfatase N-terminal domain-containing protein n=1 Tax=Seongchinamella sediminis TaxID=2283635 RepID=A0A3L7DT89_9GAMM|nr:sulfatase-like hydrolase/transferase [Seongchinamella sediminis]RLQ20768.1 hypothetical protein DWB85_16085 [Seongchinamella sediminis]
MNFLLLTSLAAVTSGATLAAIIFALLLTIKSTFDYSLAGPLLPADIVRQFRGDAIKSLLRLGFFAFLVALYWALWGAIVLCSVQVLLNFEAGWLMGFLAGMFTIVAAVCIQFFRCLLSNPGVIVASSNYRISRFYSIWRRLSPRLVKYSLVVPALFCGSSVALAVTELWLESAWSSGIILSTSALTLFALAWLVVATPEPRAAKASPGDIKRPNILMLGCDTLRADRVGARRDGIPLTPHLEALASRGSLFKNCYVPCGRTAPSLISLLTGTWPHTHGIRDNFESVTALSVSALPKILADAGYRTAAVSDWCGADLGKFDLGFEICDLPSDSWNLRELIGQGPKDLRLFLSLFVRNRFGKRFLPGLYYLGGVPSTELLGRDVRRHISELSSNSQPFLLNAFFSTTHPPFASEHPYYTQFADPNYNGPSKFAMARLTDPFEIIRAQKEPRKDFDLDQILSLYDGCVKRFDDEVGHVLSHLESCGLADNTIIVLYSDHGMEFFEHGTWGQGNSVIGEQSARIPLIVSGPRVASANRISGIVRSIDLAPTLLDLVGLQIPTEMEGTTLLPSLQGEQLPTLAAFNESGIWLTDLPGMPADHLRYPELFELLEVPDLTSGTLAIKPRYQQRIIEAKDRMVRFGRWKLTYQPLNSGIKYCLFDLFTDPECSLDVGDAHPEIVADLRRTLHAWLRCSER